MVSRFKSVQRSMLNSFGPSVHPIQVAGSVGFASRDRLSIAPAGFVDPDRKRDHTTSAYNIKELTGVRVDAADKQPILHSQVRTHSSVTTMSQKVLIFGGSKNIGYF